VDKPIFLAIDVGTSLIKVALALADGKLLDAAFMKTKLLMPREYYCEMDMNELWRRLCRTLRLLSCRNPKAWSRIAAIGVCGQGDGLWPVDHNGHPVRNAMLWNDSRCGRLIDYTEINCRAAVQGVTPFFPGAGPVLLKWLKENEPQSYARTAKALHCVDWINYKLTGEVITDYTNASTALLKVFDKCYAYSFLDELGIPEAQDCFPKLQPSSTVIGKISPSAEKLSGVRSGVPIIAGTLDVVAVATGCGMLRSGNRGSVIGTTLCNYVVLDEANARVHIGEIGGLLCHTISGTYIRLLAGLSGGASLDWVRRKVLGNIPFSRLEIAAREIPVGSEGIIYHPYLYGERAPFRAPEASGGFFGLRARHTKYHLARAAYEGLALSLCDCYQNLPSGDEDIIVAGGVCQSRLFCQIISDCAGVPLHRNRQKELGILGVVCLLRSVFCPEVEEEPNEDDVFLPDKNAHEIYKALYERFKALREAMMPFWSPTWDEQTVDK
jgi:sugar (pentulose or hexulose) kinase